MDKLLVYNSTSLTYFGIGALTALKTKYQSLFEQRPVLVYSGGEYDGYFGVTKEGLEHKVVDKWIAEIVDAVGIFSTHSFMLPLKWDFRPNDQEYAAKEKEEIPFDKRTSLNDFALKMDSLSELWNRSFFGINNASDYNEYTYFHDYVRKVIYDVPLPNESTMHKLSQKRILLYYETKHKEGDYYEIKTKKNTYKLSLCSISMHVFNTGVVVFTFNLENHKHQYESDILSINEFGRRFYPQYLAGHEYMTSAVKESFLANHISICVNGMDSLTEDFSRYNTVNQMDTPCFENGKYKNNVVIFSPIVVSGLLNNQFVYDRDAAKKPGTIQLTRITDDRMFFHCWYNAPEKVTDLARKNIISCKSQFAFLTSDFWYAFIFGDKDSSDPSIKDEYMKEEQIRKHTYSRWIDYAANGGFDGTLYGITRDSFVCLGGTFPQNHMKTMYYQISVLSLAQRAGLLRFSAEVSNLSDLAAMRSKKEKGENQYEVGLLITDLYLNYIEFINKMNFKEVTSQIQGIEMYTQMQEVMNIPRDIKDLDGEIDELNRFANLLYQEEQVIEAQDLTRIAAIFLPSTLFASILGMNMFDKLKFSWYPDLNSIVWTLLVLIPSTLMITCSKRNRQSFLRVFFNKTIKK